MIEKEITNIAESNDSNLVKVLKAEYLGLLGAGAASAYSSPSLFSSLSKNTATRYPSRNTKYEGKKVNRNAICPCGSNMKFKRCCGK